ncbi:putative alkylglycerol monooxygenase [Penaeus vannamei]|uniref:Putative alkylglycerol monooxygenase n=1 Tax=Penaeus vannamei TaxID=6689 RepID=A0A423SLY9_PENVA|nr:putative alkylglycerol monooxygenase [Penaeus vannamei]
MLPSHSIPSCLELCQKAATTKHEFFAEVALLWSAHHVHHSSEDMNMFVAPRVSIFRPFYKWAFYVPLVVLGLPPATMVVHMQLGVIYTAWTHNDTIPKLSKVVPYLGHAIEFVMVTPSHHRVHHGANKYCLDKNYGMVLIVYDRLFSTFAEEREDEPIVYGTLKQRDSYDIIGHLPKGVNVPFPLPLSAQSVPLCERALLPLHLVTGLA